VPISALVVRDKAPSAEEAKAGKKAEEEGLFISENGRAKFVPVRKGIMGDLDIEIVDGLKERQDVIVGPYDALRQMKDGLLVKADVKAEVKK
jgi:HlyD family secretion protein